MAVSELLRLVVDADTRGAVQGMERLGATASRELTRAEKSLDRWGNRLTTIGAGMVGIGSVALVGLGAAAMASEEANLATVKLENTLKNMPQLAGESSQQFIDLADSIQDVTAADADQIVAAEAMLGTFRLTADEIKSITPLVVDYARKFDVDLVSAATQVGKALDGNVGALKRNGVSINEALFATDRYAAVQQALSEQVGGFAEAEGKTFAGSLQRMKNELGDLAEGVGTGAVDAFTSMFGVVNGLTDRLNDLSPAAQGAIGKFATFGSVGLIAAGGLSFMIGQAIKMRDHFATAAESVSKLISKVRGMSGASLAMGGFVTAVTAAAVALDQYNRAQQQANTQRLTSEFLAAGQSASEMDAVMSSAAKHGVTELIGVFGELASTNRVAAERFIDQAEAAGASDRVISQMRDHLETTAAAEAQTAEDTAGLAGAMDDAAGATDGATSALQAYADELRAQFDPLFAAVHATRQLNEANAAVTAAELTLAAATRDHGAGSAEATAAQDDLTNAQLSATEAALGQESALVGLKDAVVNQGLSVAAAKQKLAEWVRQGAITQSTADATARELDGVAGAANRIPAGRHTNVTATDRATGVIDSVKRQLFGIPTSKDVTVRVHATGTAALNIIQNKLLQFATGGVVPGPKGAPTLALVHGGETVVPTHDPAAMREFTPAAITAPAIATSGGRGGVTYVTVNVTGPDPDAVVRAIKQWEQRNGPARFRQN